MQLTTTEDDGVVKGHKALRMVGVRRVAVGWPASRCWLVTRRESSWQVSDDVERPKG